MRLFGLLLFLVFCPLWAEDFDKIRIIAFDNLQGRVQTTQQGLGASDLADYISFDYRQPIVVSLGDNYFGSFNSFEDKGLAVAKILQKIDVRYTLLSSLDLCFGLEQYQKINAYAKIKTLGTNLQSENSKKLRNFPKSSLVTHKGIKILFLGGYTQDFFVNNDIQTTSLAASIEAELKKILASETQNLPNAIILMLNFPDGFDTFSKRAQDKELEKVCQIKGISAILISDKNRSYFARINGTPIISSSLQKNEVSQIDLEFKPKFKFLTSAQAQIVTIPASASQETPQKSKTIATCGEELSDKAAKKDFRTPLGSFICRAVAENQSADFALLPQNIFLQPLQKGNVTALDIYNLFGKNYRLFTAKISGKELKQILQKILFETKNYQIYAPELKYDKSKIVSLQTAGLFGFSPVKDDKFYTVLTTQQGFVEFLGNAKDKEVCKKSLVSSLLDELDGKEINAKETK